VAEQDGSEASDVIDSDLIIGGSPGAYALGPEAGTLLLAKGIERHAGSADDAVTAQVKPARSSISGRAINQARGITSGLSSSGPNRSTRQCSRASLQWRDQCNPCNR